jgi:hypothetical protein
MARISGLSLGGRGTAPAAPAVVGVAFDLTRAPVSDFLYRPDGTAWEVEIRAGQRSVVARTADLLDRSDLLATGLEYAQRCLDIVSFEKRSEALLANPGVTHVVLFQRDNALVLQHVDASTLGVGIGAATLVVKDKDRNIKEQPVPPSVWTPGLRFYRLSQSSSDLYEAYRNLFLGLETLLDTLHPKKPREQERKWLLRALTAVAETAGLQQLLPQDARDPAAYIVDTQYDRIRLRLFHAKPSKSGGKPLDLPDPEEVTSAYERLIRIWRQIAERCLSVRSGGGGAMTYVGFKMIMDGALSSGLTMYFTEDDSPLQKSDFEISPLGKPLIPFHKTVYLGETAPGHVSLLGSFAVEGGEPLPVIHRVGAKTGESLLLVGGVTGGLEISGVDVFESQQTFRLRNLGLPKTLFGEDPG